MSLKRGDIYWVNLSPINDARRTVLVIPLSTSGTPRPPIAIEVQCLGKHVVAVCDQLRAIAKERLLESAGVLKPEDSAQIEDSLRQILSL